MLYSSLDGRTISVRMDTNIHMAKSLYCLPETIIVLLIEYIPIQHKTFTKRIWVIDYDWTASYELNSQGDHWANYFTTGSSYPLDFSASLTIQFLKIQRNTNTIPLIWNVVLNKHGFHSRDVNKRSRLLGPKTNPGFFSISSLFLCSSTLQSVSR